MISLFAEIFSAHININNNNSNNLTFIMRLKLNMLCKLKGAGHCTSVKCLRHVAEAFPPQSHVATHVGVYLKPML